MRLFVGLLLVYHLKWHQFIRLNDCQPKWHTIPNHITNMSHGSNMNFCVAAVEHVEKAHNGSCTNYPTSKILWSDVNASRSTTDWWKCTMYYKVTDEEGALDPSIWLFKHARQDWKHVCLQDSWSNIIWKRIDSVSTKIFNMFRGIPYWTSSRMFSIAALRIFLLLLLSISERRNITPVWSRIALRRSSGRLLARVIQ